VWMMMMGLFDWTKNCNCGAAQGTKRRLMSGLAQELEVGVLGRTGSWGSPVGISGDPLRWSFSAPLLVHIVTVHIVIVREGNGRCSFHIIFA